VTNEDVTPSTEGASATSPLAIALPLVFGVVALTFLCICCYSWRRHGRLHGAGLVRGTSVRSNGYGVRQSLKQRLSGGVMNNDKPVPNAGIQLTDRASWSPTSPSDARLHDSAYGQGRNVFREELQRQDRER
jgi:hypothetical protein